MPPKKKTTKKKKSKAAEEEEEDVEAPKPKKKEKPKTAREALDMYDNTVDTHGSATRKYNKDFGDSELGCCGKCLRYLVLSINIFFILIGFVLLVYGGWYYNFNTAATELAGTTWAAFVIVLGICILGIGIIGLVGAKYQNRVVLFIYFAVIIILFILTLSAGAWVLSLKGQESSLITTAWNAAPSNVRLAAQGAYSCCGLASYNDTLAALPCPAAATAPCLPILVGQVAQYYSSFGALLLIVCITFFGDIGLTWWLFKVLNRLKARAGTST